MKERFLNNIHPGDILLEDFLKPMGLSQYQLSKETDISHASITRIIKGQQSITLNTAAKLSDYFGNSVKFWLGLQMDYDVEEHQRKNKEGVFAVKSRPRKVSKGSRQKSMTVSRR